LKQNPINLSNKNKLKDVKALLGVEYTSDVDEEESDEEDIIGVAGLALAKPGSLFKYDYTKDYENLTNKSLDKCLMAKEAKVIHTLQSSMMIWMKKVYLLLFTRLCVRFMVMLHYKKCVDWRPFTLVTRWSLLFNL
jgi:hypothetical protein